MYKLRMRKILQYSSYSSLLTLILKYYFSLLVHVISGPLNNITRYNFRF